MKKIEEASSLSMQDINLKKRGKKESVPRWKIQVIAIATGKITTKNCIFIIHQRIRHKMVDVGLTQVAIL